MFLILLLKATKLGTFERSSNKMLPHWPPSLELPRATKQDASPLATKLGTFQEPPS